MTVPRRVVTYPTLRSLLLAGLAVAAAALLGVLDPNRWSLPCLPLLGVAAALVAELVLAPTAAELQLELEAPPTLEQGHAASATVTARFSARGPRRLQSALQASPELDVSPDVATLDGGFGRFTLQARRRGRATLHMLQLRWRGPLGLLHRQCDVMLARELLVTVDLSPTRAAARALRTDPRGGAKLSSQLGLGGDFHGLRDYVSGDDRRAVDWKRSATRGALLVREHQPEQNHPVLLAIDTGRHMSDPVEDRSRLDWSISCALSLAFAALNVGDRVALCGFAATAPMTSGFVSGREAFGTLQAQGARLSESSDETNYTLALHILNAQLPRRALIVVYTDFTDTTGAELMLESVARLIHRHTVVFSVFRDAELQSYAQAEPNSTEVLARAVVAQALVRERARVMDRLRRLGVRVVETTPARMGGAALDAYLAISQFERG